VPAQLLITVVLIAIGWFLLIRPQQVRIREQRAMVATLEVGDRVVTAGGIHGTVRSVADETVAVEVTAGVELTVARAAIVRRLDDAPSRTPDPDPEDSVTRTDPAERGPAPGSPS
jgi:preprotein translocase subunit YajC